MDYINDEIKYDIICNKNSEYNGLFYTAVKTTGVYCIPSCSAKNLIKRMLSFMIQLLKQKLKGIDLVKFVYLIY